MLKTFEKFKQKAEPLLNELSTLRDSLVFPLLFHYQVSIAPWCVSKIYDRIAKLEGQTSKNIDIILFSTGGDADTASHIGRMLHRTAGEKDLIFIVPRVAASAATLLTFAGNKILMNSPSELGPIDPQIRISPHRYVSALSWKETIGKLIEEILRRPDIAKTTVEAILEYIPLFEAADYERLLKHTEKLAKDLLRLRMVEDKKKSEEIAKKFVRGFEYHGKAITVDECISIGLKVEEMKGKEWEIVWEFSKLWEEIFLLPGREGSDILDVSIGNGVAFLPAEEAEEMDDENTIEKLLTGLASS